MSKINNKKILIAGGSGFIGQHFYDLYKNDYDITVLSRKKNKNTLSWAELESNPALIEAYDVVINLCGESILQIWTKAAKERLYNSRINPTQKLVEIINKANKKPSCLINASAIGIYPEEISGFFAEEDALGKHFMATLCKDWEKAALKAKTRTALLRIGIVLEKNNGFLKLIRLPYLCGVGGHLGSGKQALPWIHADDLCSSMAFIIENPALDGPINAVAPAQNSLKTFCKALAQELKRPNFLHVPSGLIKLFMGELGHSLLHTPYVEPKKLLNHKFTFKYKELCPKIFH